MIQKKCKKGGFPESGRTRIQTRTKTETFLATTIKV